MPFNKTIFFRLGSSFIHTGLVCLLPVHYLYINFRGTAGGIRKLIVSQVTTNLMPSKCLQYICFFIVKDNKLQRRALAN